jgi:sugar diacid utilization regulator/GAF domain-containing protein
MSKLLKLPGLHRDELPMMALIEIGRQLTRSLDVDRVIEAIVQQTVSAVSAADAAALFLYDAESDRLIMRAATGFDAGALSRVRLRPDESMTGRVFSGRQSAIFASAEKIDEGMGSMSAENRHWYSLAISHLQHPRSVMAAPIQSAERCWGVIVVDNFSAPRNFTSGNLALLEAVASQAAVALENADLYEREKENAQRLAGLNRQLLRVTEVHDQMTRAILEGRDLQALATWLAGAVSRPLLVQDQFLNLLASAGDPARAGVSGRPADYQLVDTADMRPALDQLRSELRPLPMPSSNGSSRSLRRLAVPITGGREVLGYLLVLDAGGLEPVDVMTLETGAMAFAVAMLRERAVAETEQRLTGELLWSLISADPDERVRQRAAQMGVDLKKRYAVMLVAIDQQERLEGRPEDDGEGRLWKRKLQSVAERFIWQRAPGSLVTMDSDNLVVLVALAGGRGELGPPAGLAAQLQAALARDLPDLTFSIALGRQSDDPSEFRNSYREALRALRLNRVRGGRQQIIAYEALGTTRLILDSGDRAHLDRLARETLGPVVEYDRRHKTELVKTLLAYLKEGQRPAATARRLFIHVNTLNYRLQRIEELLGGSFRDWDRWLDVQLALKILELLE